MILIVDTHGLIHRSFHAFTDEMKDPDGEQVNAIYGTFRLLIQAILDTQPMYIFAAADSPGGTFRHETLDGYKGTRPPLAPTLKNQIIRTKELLKEGGFATLAVPGYEADDIIATLVMSYKQESPITVLSSDADLLQLVDDGVTVRQPGRTGKSFNAAAVFEKMGVTPEQVADFKALAGDSSDNIKGVVGIGAKGASQLLQAHGDLEGIYDHLDEIKETMRKKLIAGRVDAFTAQSMTRLHLGTPLIAPLDGARVDQLDFPRLWEIFRELQFRSLYEPLKKVHALAQKQGVIAERKTLF